MVEGPDPKIFRSTVNQGVSTSIYPDQGHPVRCRNTGAADRFARRLVVSSDSYGIDFLMTNSPRFIITLGEESGEDVEVTIPLKKS